MDYIPQYDIGEQEPAASFSIRTMEMIDAQAKGQPDRPHRHNYYTVLWSFTATGVHHIDFNSYPVEPDSIFFISPGQVHQVVTDPDPTGIVLLFTREFLMHNNIREHFISDLNLFRDCSETPPLKVNDETARHLHALTGAMLEQYTRQDDFQYEALGAYLKLFLIRCHNACTLPDANTQNAQAGITILSDFKKLVEAHFARHHKVSDYAAWLSVSPGHLNHIVKTFLGASAKEYLQNRLLLEAKRLALFSGKNAKEVAYELGFEDPSYFSKFFKNGTGQTISEFRQAFSGHL